MSSSDDASSDANLQRTKIAMILNSRERVRIRRSANRTGAILESIVSLAKCAAVIAVAGAAAYGIYNFDALMNRFSRLRDDLTHAQRHETHARENLLDEKLKTALGSLKTRVASLELINQTTDAATGIVSSRVRFTETDSDGNPVSDPLEVTIPGSKVFVNSQVIKFNDSLVESGDRFRGHSLVSFRGLFTEEIPFQNQVEIDNPRVLGQRTQASIGYPGRDRAGMSEDQWNEAQTKLWSDFWQYANKPEQMRDIGIRNMQGQAPSINFNRSDIGKKFVLNLSASEGLSIRRPGTVDPGEQAVRDFIQRYPQGGQTPGITANLSSPAPRPETFAAPRSPRAAPRAVDFNDSLPSWESDGYRTER
jgi:hypothetical protein